MDYALITGASKGIGKAVAEELARRKFGLLLVARSEDALKQTAGELGARYGVEVDWLALDLSTADAAQKVYDWCMAKGYAVQALVNNAGYGLSGPFEKYSLEEHANMMQLNMGTLVGLTRLFLPAMRNQSRAYIMNIASSAAYQAVPLLSLYAATKSFVLSFSRGLHQELRSGTVSVTCISPGATDTDFPNRAQLGEKGMKTAEKFNMTPSAVASLAVRAMLAGRSEVVVGLVNKVGALMAWLLPKSLVERTAMKIYE
ncbi:MAG: SDR family oxidoreductase [Bacteroidota bacterium]|nr:SDR family oxidoreductase [Bacteroidota bacterium]MDP4217476.1 SDR family oxidoreductase [Bacteroidota bacterium]MDP4253245.1 SDR family oxidoreductase [Bacteroidota bacterium]MDP4257415.1 SDR family oxidoreductase [Bacteroidota bacterium]